MYGLIQQHLEHFQFYTQLYILTEIHMQILFKEYDIVFLFFGLVDYVVLYTNYSQSKMTVTAYVLCIITAYVLCIITAYVLCIIML